MQKLPKLKDLDVKGKNILVRVDLEFSDRNSSRGRTVDKLVDFLKSKKASKIKLIGHKGITEMNSWWEGVEVDIDIRKNPGEEKNDLGFTKKLAEGWDIFINEAFATSHRNHASIVGLPKILPTYFGFRFLKEVEKLSQEFEEPIVYLLSGTKKYKLKYIKSLKEVSQKVLVGGRLPDFLGDEGLESVRNQSGKVIIGNLVQDKEDITLNTIDLFIKEAGKARTIIVAGPLGKFEESGHMQGTKSVFEKIAKLNAYKIALGGDTEKSLEILKILDDFDWISVGGGASLEFLTTGTLPAIEALQS